MDETNSSWGIAILEPLDLNVFKDEYIYRIKGNELFNLDILVTDNRYLFVGNMTEQRIKCNMYNKEYTAKGF